MSMTERHTIGQEVISTPIEKNTIRFVVKNLIGTRSVTAFCDEAGLSRGYVSRLLNDKLESKPTVRTLAKLAHTSDRNVDETFSVLLSICGYNVSEEERINEIRIAKREARVHELRRNDLEMEEYEDVNLKASAIGLLFSTLLTMGVLVRPMGVFDPDACIEFGIDGLCYERVIAVPAFCGNTSQEFIAERDALSRMMKSALERREQTPLYLILTDDRDVFDYMCDLIKKLRIVCAYVLKANKEGTKFIDQRFFSTDESRQEDVFMFVKEIRNQQ